MFDQLLFPTEQNSKMSEDSNTWPDAISTIIAQKFPDLVTQVSKIIFQKVEKTRGYAVGYVMMEGDAFRIPFIIDKFVLQPLDVFIKGTRYGHLNRKTSSRLIAASWPFKQMNAHDHAQMFKKTAGCIEFAEPTRAAIESDEAFIKHASYIAETMPEIVVELGKLLEKEASSSEEVSPFCAIELNDFKTGFNLYSLIAKDESVSIKTAAEKLGPAVVSQALTTPVILNQTTKEYEPVVNDTPQDQLKSDTNYPKTINMADGVAGFIRGNLYELRDVKAPDATKAHIFLSTRKEHPIYRVVTDSTPRNQFYTSSEKGTAEDALDDLQRPTHRGGAMALLMNDVVYGPFEVHSSAVMNGEYIYSIRDGFEYDKLQLHMSKQVKQIVVDGDVVYAPLSARMIWLGTPFAKGGIEKTAALWVKLTTTPDKSAFTLIDSGVTGIPPANLQTMRKTKTIAALMNAGLSEAEAKIAIQKTLAEGSYSFQVTPTATKSEGQTRTELVSEPPTAEMKKVANAIVDLIDNSGILKIAAESRDRHTVDLALGLRMITPESVRKFKLLVPKIDDTIDGLCKLLLAKRLGGDSIPVDEKKIETSVSTLSEIGYELTGV